MSERHLGTQEYCRGRISQHWTDNLEPCDLEHFSPLGTSVDKGQQKQSTREQTGGESRGDKLAGIVGIPSWNQ